MSAIRLLVPALVYAGILGLSSMPAERFDGVELPAIASYLVHLVVYTALGAALRWALEGTRRPSVVTVMVGLVLAVVDEAFQSTVPGRHPAALDVLVDLVGVSLGAFGIGRLRLHRQVRRALSSERRR